MDTILIKSLIENLMCKSDAIRTSKEILRRRQIDYNIYVQEHAHDLIESGIAKIVVDWAAINRTNRVIA